MDIGPIAGDSLEENPESGVLTPTPLVEILKSSDSE